MRAISGIAVAYILIIAVAMAYTSDMGAKMSGIAFGEALFAMPMVIASLLAFFMKRPDPRRILLIFELAYSAFTLLVFVRIFAGDHDAQYQTALLLIPLIGLPAVTITGVVVAVLAKRTQTESF